MLRAPDRMLEIAAAIAPDGGRAVLEAARATLLAITPFDAGEIVLAGPRGFDRHPFAGEGQRGEGQPAEGQVGAGAAAGGAGGAGRLLVGADLATRVGSLGTVIRFDDLREAEGFPETAAAMRVGGFRSMLSVPIVAGRDRRGVLAIVRTQGWGLVGLSLHVLTPVACMAGLALHASLRLTEADRAVAPAAGDAGGDAGGGAASVGAASVGAASVGAASVGAASVGAASGGAASGGAAPGGVGAEATPEAVADLRRRLEDANGMADLATAENERLQLELGAAAVDRQELQAEIATLRTEIARLRTDPLAIGDRRRPEQPRRRRGEPPPRDEPPSS